MKKFEGDLILSDLDGTLVFETGKISRENEAALNYFMQNGGHFAYSTGRLCGYVDKLSLKANAPCVTHNGALIKHGLGALFSNPFSNDISFVIDDIIKNNESINQVRCCTEKEIYYYPQERPENEPIYKYVFVTDTPAQGERLANYMKAKYSTEFEIFRSWNCGTEILKKGSNKGVCAKILKKHLNMKNLYCIGDYENDISMIEVADISFAPENGIDEIKKKADVITPSNIDNAIKYMIYYLDKIKR